MVLRSLIRLARPAALALLAAAPLASLPALAQEKFIVVASTTSTEQSGLFPHLLPAFTKATGVDVRVVAVGTGQALDIGRRGDADVVFVHDAAAEEKFVAEGYGLPRREVMYNDFVLIGPKNDPAGVRGNDIVAALAKLVASPFVSRGDKSGTHAAELRYWKLAGIDEPAGKVAKYQACGCGMGPALNIAASTGAYVLSDRGTWLNFKNRGEAAILVEGDKRLFNQYGVIVVDPARHPKVKKDLAQQFADWVTGPEGQAAIASYKIGGEQLFFSERPQVNRLLGWTLGMVAAMSSVTGVSAQEVVLVYAAGSLREVFSEAAKLWQAQGGTPLKLEFGASGLLRERIEKGEQAQVFASADTDHPQRLAAAGSWQTPVVFTRNSLCVIAQPQIDVNTHNLLDTLLRSDVRLGTSTPRADPAGDYAWALFRKADGLRPGTYASLDAKALKLTGGPTSPKPPAGRGVYAWVMDEGQADVFLTYCTNAVSTQREVPRLKIVQVPEEFQVTAAYALTVRSGAGQPARDFADFVRSPPAQAVFARAGFGAP